MEGGDTSRLLVEKGVPKGSVSITVNGQVREFVIGYDIDIGDTLAFLLRERLGLMSVKVACDEGACGACTVILDGRATLSCMLLAVEADGHQVLTVEGLPPDDPVVEAFAEQSGGGYGLAIQCGYCTPGFVMATKALLIENPDPTLAEVEDGLAGNICRCGCYAAIAQAALHAAGKMRAREGGRAPRPGEVGR